MQRNLQKQPSSKKKPVFPMPNQRSYSNKYSQKQPLVLNKFNPEKFLKGDLS